METYHEEQLRTERRQLDRQAHSHSRRSADTDDAGAIGDAEDAVTLVREEKSGPDELLERAEEAAHVTELIAGLKPDEREALILLGLGYSYTEIAELRGWSRRKVDRCLTEGRAIDGEGGEVVSPDPCSRVEILRPIQLAEALRCLQGMLGQEVTLPPDNVDALCSL